MYIPGASVFMRQTPHKGYFRIFEGPKEILGGPKKQSSRKIGNFTLYPYIHTFTPTNYQKFQYYPFYHLSFYTYFSPSLSNI